MRGKCRRTEAADRNEIKNNLKSPRCMTSGFSVHWMYRCISS